MAEVQVARRRRRENTEMSMIDDYARRIETLGKRIATMPFGEPDSPERRERDRLCDTLNALSHEHHCLVRAMEDDDGRTPK
jgi:hypothetical protein